MFYYYRTKADLALAVADVFVEETQSLITEAEAAAVEPRQRIRFPAWQARPVKPEPGRERMPDQRRGARFPPRCA
jgi:AcrR family transcriptional regulator